MLNLRAKRLVDNVMERAESLGIETRTGEGGGTLIDCGVDAAGGLEAGLVLARISMADLATLSLTQGTLGSRTCPFVEVRTDHPDAACLASQYAGWAISVDEFFAMGSGPMRAARAREPIFEKIGHTESPELVVGCLESRKLPGSDVIASIAEEARVSPEHVYLAVAPTGCLAGAVQVVARSVETALHKLTELGFDTGRVASGFGSAPLPPVSPDDLVAIGRTNDCVLYGARTVLWVTGDDASIEDIGPGVPSCSSPDHGAPFQELFERYDRDFYKIDPGLFSPAEIVFQNIETGRTHFFGRVESDLLADSLFS